ncbi:histidine phosphatase family protein [Streptomyces boluensis]|uniref:Histidine phosphatase family protein n=1 Tax=Streptomyces boluensis TaxID=1775135 RepID=A0A964UU92_9ACTN|nr:histidine phosphatase family protein [Streptomyces boluensis]NBE51735.1 histidine phosphatase family protein [Streptomyces boluensis]
MTVRLTLLCAAASAERTLRFGDLGDSGDLPPDERELRQAQTVAAALPQAAAVFTGPSRRCRRTTRAVSRGQAIVEPALRDVDMGRWDGLTPEEVAAEDAAAFRAWMTDPEATPHGGESVSGLCQRIASWLDALPADVGRMLAVVDQAVARAAVIHALAAPPQSFWRVDAPPLSAVQLTGRSGRWNLRMGNVALPSEPEDAE